MVYSLSALLESPKELDKYKIGDNDADKVMMIRNTFQRKL